MNNLSVNDQLTQGLKELDLSLSAEQQHSLLDFIKLLSKWNRVYNLTAIHNLNDMVSYHLLDSLSIAPYLFGQRIIDIGTGGGLPGIPLAIAFPELEFCLLDSSRKKTIFLQQVCHHLQLKNVVIVNDRVENYRPDLKFDTVMSRAFASLQEMIAKTQHLCAKSGKFLAMKGKYPKMELDEIADQYKILTVQHLIVPGIDAERHVVIIEG